MRVRKVILSRKHPGVMVRGIVCLRTQPTEVKCEFLFCEGFFFFFGSVLLGSSPGRSALQSAE